jgi:hypothetical protein
LLALVIRAVYVGDQAVRFAPDLSVDRFGHRAAVLEPDLVVDRLPRGGDQLGCRWRRQDHGFALLTDPHPDGQARLCHEEDNSRAGAINEVRQTRLPM